MRSHCFVPLSPLRVRFSCARTFVTRQAFHKLERRPPSCLPAGSSRSSRGLQRMSSSPASSGEEVTVQSSGTETAMPSGPLGIANLSFEGTFVSTLPADVERKNFTRQVRDASFSFVNPTDPRKDDQRKEWRLADPEGEAAAPPQLPRGLICWSTAAAELLDLDGSLQPEGEELSAVVDVLGGFGPLWPGMRPYAQCYSGHQFGSFAGQLGDGRAITLGEYVNKREERWEVQLKGAGMTPYSRRADGRAVLRSSIREFLCSEAMYHLGVPTTRALALVSTGTGVIRDMFYSGDPQFENGAVCTRMAPSFLRIGSFENPASLGEHERLQQTADYAIEHHFPALKSLSSDVESTERNRYGALLAEVVRLNAEMVARWQGVGFVHGVLNSDNTSILGLTIDYGPYGFLDAYDPQYTPNTTDIPGRRYRFEQQADAIHWNLHKFASAMVPLCGLADAQACVNSFPVIYEDAHNRYFAKKLGVSRFTSEDKSLLKELLSLMAKGGVDFTNCWRSLSSVGPSSTPEDIEAIYAPLIKGKDGVDASEWAAWMEKYRDRIVEDSELSESARVQLMNRTNPVYILRNYMAQEAIDAANEGDFSIVRELYDLLRDPFVEQDKFKKYTQEPPKWAARPGVFVNSCSS